MTAPAPGLYRGITDEERHLAVALGQCRFGANRRARDFAAKMRRLANATDPLISERQAYYLRRLAWHYRRQLDTEVLALALPPTDRQPELFS